MVSGLVLAGRHWKLSVHARLSFKYEFIESNFCIARSPFTIVIHCK